MNRRGFLRMLGIAPIVAPSIVPSLLEGDVLGPAFWRGKFCAAPAPRLVLDGDMICAGSITASRVSVSTLSAITAKLGGPIQSIVTPKALG